MRVLNVGNFYYARQAQLFYVMCRKLTNGFISNGHNVYNFDDRMMARVTNIIPSRSLGKRRVNESFISCCINFQPDFIVLNFADLITVQTLEEIRKSLPNTRIANIFLDPLDSRRNRQRVAAYHKAVDMSFVTTAGQAFAELQEQVPNLYFIPNAVDKRVENENIFTKTNQTHDVFFSVGSYKGSPERVDKALELARWVPRANYNYFGFGGVPSIWGMRYFAEMARSRIGLNFSRFEDHYLYTSDRLAHYMGNGLLTVLDRASGLEHFFTNDEALFFSSLEELAEKLEYYLAHDDLRQKVAQAGHDKIHAIHSVEQVCQYIIERSFDMPLSQTYEWPTEISDIVPD
ncbi:MAG: glycosyltransferase family protein [Parvibaculales bacterium]